MRTLYRELLRGKGIWRSSLYDALVPYAAVIREPILDIASGKDPGYWRILGINGNKGIRVSTVDADQGACPSILHDMDTGPLPCADGSFATVFMINCIYSFSDYRAALREIHRILSVDGVAFISFPFIFPHTPEPRDFFRFSDEGVRMACADAELSVVSCRPLGGRWSSAAYLISPFLRPYFIFALPVCIIALFFDRLSQLVFPALPRAPMGYLAVVKRI